MKTERRRIQSISTGVNLLHVEEFCASFPCLEIQHGLTFQKVDSWGMARLLVDAAENYGFHVIWCEFHQGDVSGDLDLRLSGNPASDPIGFWGSVETFPEVSLIKWQMRADFEQGI